MSDRLIRLPYDGDTYELESRDLTVGKLRQLKAWFGEDYGAYLPLMGLIMRFDADAIAAAIWIAVTKAGKQCPEPRMLDCSIIDVIELNQDQEEKQPDPTPAATPTPASKGTASKSSAPETSSVSPTSAD